MGTKEDTRKDEDSGEGSDEGADMRGAKKRRVQDSPIDKKKTHPKKSGLKDDAPTKQGSALGGLIGRKRKMRKQKGKA